MKIFIYFWIYIFFVLLLGLRSLFHTSQPCLSPPKSSELWMKFPTRYVHHYIYMCVCVCLFIIVIVSLWKLIFHQLHCSCLTVLCACLKWNKPIKIQCIHVLYTLCVCVCVFLKKKKYLISLFDYSQIFLSKINQWKHK